MTRADRRPVSSVAIAALAASLAAGCRDAEPPPTQEPPPPAPADVADPAPRAVAGDAERGAVLLHEYGCGACHVIPGVLAARGESGPPLDAYAERLFIAGALPNRADHLIAWIVNPQAIEPGTAMPNLGVTEPHARDMTAYLYTLRRGPQLRLPRALRLPPDDGAWRTVTRPQR